MMHVIKNNVQKTMFAQDIVQLIIGIQYLLMHWTMLLPQFCHHHILFLCLTNICQTIKLLESPIPATAPTPSQKAHFDNISGTKRGSIDPLVSKRPEKNSE